MSETADHSEAEYRAIESTFGETARGRWFLAEFARRSRKADLVALMTAMERLRDGASGGKHDIEGLKASLAEMAAAIEQGTGASTPGAFEALAAALREAESATSDILDAAEHIQEVAWTLRERGADRGICDLLDTRSSEIYAACGLHDAAVKGIAGALRAGRLLEERIASLCAAWGVPAAKPAPAEAEDAVRPAKAAPVEPGAPALADEARPAAEAPEPAPGPEPAQAYLVPAQEPAKAQEPANAEEPVQVQEPVQDQPEISAAARRRQQLAALAGIDSLGTREKLKLFT